MSASNPFDARVLETVDRWRAPTAAVAVVGGAGLVASRGPMDRPLRWASVTKLVTASAVLVAVDRGILGLDDPAGPPGSTIRHLLAHASGLAFDDDTVLGPPGRQRTYSNTGFDRLAAAVGVAAGRPFAGILQEWVLEPLGMTATHLDGRPSEGLVGPCHDLATLARELLAPRVLPAARLAEATTVTFPGLRGVLPGFGLQDPNDWGLGFEIRDGKAPHWTATTGSPRTFGHFGATGTFLWVDPDAGIALACLTDRPFGSWAGEAWPALSDAVLANAGRGPVPADGASPTSPRIPARP